MLRCEIDTGRAVAGHTLATVGKFERTAAIFPNVKTIRNAFDLEYQIVHDLSFLITPEFHHRDTIAYHGYTLLREREGIASVTWLHKESVSRAETPESIASLAKKFDVVINGEGL